MTHKFTNLDIDLPSGDTLEARIYRTSERPAKGGVIIIPGLGGVINPSGNELQHSSGDFYDLMADYLVEKNYDSLLYNHRGHGKSSGVLNIEDFIADFEYVSENVMGEYAGILYAVGYSLGGYISLMGAVRRPDLYKGIVAISAPHSIDNTLPEWWDKTLKTASHLPAKLQSGFLAATNMIIGKRDRGSLKKYLQEIIQDRDKRSVLFTQMNNCRLPNPCLQAYLDWSNAPPQIKSLSSHKISKDIPVLLVHGESEGLIHPLGKGDEYVSLFKENIDNLEVLVMNEISHGYRTEDSSSFLESDKTLPQIIERFFSKSSE